LASPCVVGGGLKSDRAVGLVPDAQRQIGRTERNEVAVEPRYRSERRGVGRGRDPVVRTEALPDGRDGEQLGVKRNEHLSARWSEWILTRGIDLQQAHHRRSGSSACHDGMDRRTDRLAVAAAPPEAPPHHMPRRTVLPVLRRAGILWLRSGQPFPMPRPPGTLRAVVLHSLSRSPKGVAVVSSNVRDAHHHARIAVRGAEAAAGYDRAVRVSPVQIEIVG